jgi:hypothetical protein
VGQGTDDLPSHKSWRILNHILYGFRTGRLDSRKKIKNSCTAVTLKGKVTRDILVLFVWESIPHDPSIDSILHVFGMFEEETVDSRLHSNNSANTTKKSNIRPDAVKKNR